MQNVVEMGEVNAEMRSGGAQAPTLLTENGFVADGRFENAGCHRWSGLVSWRAVLAGYANGFSVRR